MKASNSRKALGRIQSLAFAAASAGAQRLGVSALTTSLRQIATLPVPSTSRFSTASVAHKMAPTRASRRKFASRSLFTASPSVKPEPTDPELPSLSDSPAKRKRGAPIKADPSEIEDLLSSTSSTVKKKEELLDGTDSVPVSPSKKSTLDRKLAAYKASIVGSPFPDHPLPTAEEAENVAWILGDFHGYKRGSEGGSGLPKYTTPKGEDKWGGCGDVPSVLDAVVRTVLSCNTSSRNSSAAHRSMTEHFGVQNWEAMHSAPESELVEAIRCGGLANNKARTIKGILAQTLERHGKLSLDHLHNATDDEIMQELVRFNGVGPKVASCVLAFCIGRQSMAVDTHVFRLCKALRWVPEKANRDQTYYHLHERVPGHLKYALHVLLIKHGKMCRHCSAKRFATVREERDTDAEEGGEKEGEKERLKDRPCPLKAAGLLGRKANALKDAAGAKKEDADTTASSPVKKKRKTETQEEPLTNDAGEVDYAAALSKARSASACDLFHLVQKPGSTRLKSSHFSLDILHADSLSSEQRKRVFSLFECNMKAMYLNSVLGWKRSSKRKELFDSESRFAILRPAAAEGAEIAAFAMFRFDTEPCHPTKDPVAKKGEDKVEVVYLYEIQVSKENQRNGLGKQLMDVVYELAKGTMMRKVMLTVFDENKGANKFYERQGYRVDPISPSLDAEKRESVDFETMYKVVEQ